MKLPWQKFEQLIAELFDGKVIKGSGNSWSNKGDVKSDRFIISCKYTDKKQMILKLDVLEELEMMGLKQDKTALLCISMNDRIYTITQINDFLSLLNGGD